MFRETHSKERFQTWLSFLGSVWVSQVGIARAVHSEDNKTFLKDVLNNFTSTHASLNLEDELLALERVGRSASVWRKEEDRLREEGAVAV